MNTGAADKGTEGGKKKMCVDVCIDMCARAYGCGANGGDHADRSFGTRAKDCLI